MDSVHRMRFHKLPLQCGNPLGALIIKLEVRDGPASAGIQVRWFHQWQLRIVESHQLLANLQLARGLHRVLHSNGHSHGHSQERCAATEHFFPQIPADALADSRSTEKYLKPFPQALKPVESQALNVGARAVECHDARYILLQDIPYTLPPRI